MLFRSILKADTEGRTVDVHSLRHTFATLLSQSGVLPRTAQELMRHGPSVSLRALSLSKGDTRLTMSTYTHLGLLDTAGAVEALPSIEVAATNPSKKARTRKNDRVTGAEIGDVGAENGAGRQSTNGTCCHVPTKRTRLGGRPRVAPSLRVVASCRPVSPRLRRAGPIARIRNPA